MPGSSLGGHRHDWEHVVVWVQDNQVQYVSTSSPRPVHRHAAHAGPLRRHPPQDRLPQGRRRARTASGSPNANDEPPENHYHTWQYPPLVGWNGYPAGAARQADAPPTSASATIKIKDGSFESLLAASKPAAIPFNPQG